VAFKPAQWARLQAIFPNGVCDWSKLGIEQQDLLGTRVFFEFIKQKQADAPVGTNVSGAPLRESAP